MNISFSPPRPAVILLSLAAIAGVAPLANAAPPEGTPGLDARAAHVVEHWTPERRAAAIPRDLVIDRRGLVYLRMPDGSLRPYGHEVAAEVQAGGRTPMGKPVPGDITPPVISGMDPASGATIGASYTFAATVTDSSGVKSVTFTLQKGSSPSQSFSASQGANDRWSVSLQGFTDGVWSWWVTAKDNAAKGGNTGSSDPVNFTVDTGSGGGSSGGSTVTNAQWTGGGTVQTAAGRLYFEMPNNAKRKGPWSGYVCSGTVATDQTTGRSVILTAAHCVYDDANKAFARNVMFIPNQAGTTGSGTDLNCSNDPLGCWIPAFGVVDNNWALGTFPNNVAWDYAYYVVNDMGARSGSSAPYAALDFSAGSLAIDFGQPNYDQPDLSDHTHALGYSYNEDPKFMYCAEDMTTTGDYNWWLPSCGLSGGSSGGPWMQPVSGGGGPIISVNSWGYTNSPGMAGPKLWNTSASFVFSKATSCGAPNGTGTFSGIPTSDGDAGLKVTATSGCN